MMSANAVINNILVQSSDYIKDKQRKERYIFRRRHSYTSRSILPAGRMIMRLCLYPRRNLIIG